VTDAGIVSVEMELLKKAKFPMLVTDSGIVSEVNRFESNAETPIVSKPAGRFTSDSALL
jgi:hypothetical protein